MRNLFLNRKQFNDRVVGILFVVLTFVTRTHAHAYSTHGFLLNTSKLRPVHNNYRSLSTANISSSFASRMNVNQDFKQVIDYYVWDYTRDIEWGKVEEQYILFT